MSALPRYTLEPLPRLDDLARAWQALEPLASPSFFTSWAWIGSLLETMPERGAMALLRGVAMGDTVALAVLGRHTTWRHGLLRTHGLFLNRSGDPRLDCTFIEYNGLLARRSCAGATLDHFADWFLAEAPDADELHLSGILAPAQPAHGALQTVQSLPTFSVDLTRVGDAGGDVAALLSPNTRQQLRRALHAYDADGKLRLREAAVRDEALAFFDGLKRLHVASWQRRGKAHAFANPHFETFHRHLIEHHTACVQLLQIAAGDHVLGYLYNLRRDGHVYAYQSGFADADRKRRPGVISHYLAINHNHARGARIYDFMAGRNRLKESFATDRHTLYWQIVQRPCLKYRLEHAARAVKGMLYG